MQKICKNVHQPMQRIFSHIHPMFINRGNSCCVCWTFTGFIFINILINGCQKLHLTDQLDWLLRIGSLLRGRDLVPLLACTSSSTSTSSPPLSSRCCCDFALVRLLPLPLPCPVAGLNSSAPPAVPCVRSALLCTSRPLLLDLPPSNPPPPLL